MTYNQGGTMQQTDLGPPIVVTLPSHGVWKHQNGRQYSSAFRRLTFNPDRTFARTGVVRQAISLGEGGDTYTAIEVRRVRRLCLDISCSQQCQDNHENENVWSGFHFFLLKRLDRRPVAAAAVLTLSISEAA